MEAKVIDFATGIEQSVINIKDSIFGCDYNEALIHQVVTAYRAAGRAGTKAQKSRSEVNCTGAKPWRQKGTGRARAGSAGSPIWRKGGVTFAAKPRNFSQKVNSKMYRGAMRSILSRLLSEDRVTVVNNLKIDTAKTKVMVEKLAQINIDHALVIDADLSQETYLATRNIKNIIASASVMVDPVSLIRYHKVLITEAGIKSLEERFA